MRRKRLHVRVIERVYLRNQSVIAAVGRAILGMIRWTDAVSNGSLIHRPEGMLNALHQPGEPMLDRLAGRIRRVRTPRLHRHRFGRRRIVQVLVALHVCPFQRYATLLNHSRD